MCLYSPDVNVGWDWFYSIRTNWSSCFVFSHSFFLIHAFSWSCLLTLCFEFARLSCLLTRRQVSPEAMLWLSTCINEIRKVSHNIMSTIFISNFSKETLSFPSMFYITTSFYPAAAYKLMWGKWMVEGCRWILVYTSLWRVTTPLM